MPKRRIFKWVGVVACGTLLMAFALTEWWDAASYCGNFNGFIERGCVWLRYDVHTHYCYWYVNRTIHGQSFWWFRVYRNVGGATTCIIPLWIPFVLTAIPTIIAWRRDRRIPPGHCQKCGYSLTGNESGVCPECGTETEKL